MKDFRRHGIVFVIATILNTISMAFVMIPSFISDLNYFLEELFELTTLVNFSHAILGIVAGGLALIVVLSWAIQPPPSSWRLLADKVKGFLPGERLLR